MKSFWLRRLVNFWPPFLFNSISATYIAKDFREIHVALKLRFYNRNYVGVHFGGNLFAMTDPLVYVNANAKPGARLLCVG